MDVDGYRIVNVYKPQPTRLLLISQCSLTPFSMLTILIVHMSTGVIEPTGPMESALLLGLVLTALSLSTIQRMWPLFILAAGTLAPTMIYLSVLIQTAVYLTDASKRSFLGHKLAKSLLPPDSPDADLAYQDFYNVIRTAVQNSIPCGRRNNHISCWDAGCENLYQTFLQSPEGSDSNRAANALLLRLDKKHRNRWSGATPTDDFSHCSRKVWSIFNNLTGRSRRSPRHCVVSANAIASQLIRNGRYEGIRNGESSQLISQKVTDLWRATPTSSVNISESFTSQRSSLLPSNT